MAYGEADVAEMLRVRDEPTGYGRYRPADEYVPAYTASLDAAKTLVPEGFGWTVGDKSPWPSIAWCEIEGLPWKAGYGWAVDRRLMVEAATPALALTAASLRARAASLNGGAA